MNTMNIISTLFNNDNFIDILTFSIISLTTLFIIILFLAYRDKHKKDKPRTNILKELDNKKKVNNNKIKEDITFEMPVVSENLQRYKESIEKSFQNDNDFKEAKPIIQNIKLKTPKQTKVLDIDKIVETPVEPTFNLEKINEKFRGISNNESDLLQKKRQ